MHPLINIAIKAARNAARIILRTIDRLDTVKIGEKKHNDFVTEIDHLVEQDIIRTIHESYPDHAIIAEESGVTGNNEYTWIIDPIDGTANFFHGHPHFCISIAVKHKNKIEHGLIYDPLREELFTATHGNGSYLNNHRIRVSSRKQMTGALIASGFGKRTEDNIEQYLKILSAILPLAAGTYRSGSAALDLAYIACGRLDGCYMMDLSAWDIAAGTVIIQEAGGIVTDPNGKNNFLQTGNVIAGNLYIYKIIKQLNSSLDHHAQ